jgi:type IX secretion system PorP/SprF family membrane protein
MKNIRLPHLSVYVLIGLMIAIFSSNETYGQQDPLYTHYMFNKHVYNPGFTGSNREFICATFLLHNQWAGFSGTNLTNPIYAGDPPSTQTFSIHAPIQKYLSGIGFHVVNDKIGYQYTTAFNLTLSAKKDFSIGTLQFGINGGLVERGINADWNPPEPGANDPDLPEGDQSDMIPDLGAGLYFYSPIYYFGVSVQHILGGNFDWGGPANLLVRQSYITGGLNFYLPSNPNFQIQPSFLYKIDRAKRQIDINTNVLYRDRFWGGLQYRSQDAVSLLVGMKLTPQLKFGYSYDITTTKLSQYSNGTHEVMVSYCFKIKYTPPPQIDRIIWTPRYL